jgi:hypothetical protein
MIGVAEAVSDFAVAAFFCGISAENFLTERSLGEMS